VNVVVPEGSLAHVHGFGSLDTVQVGGMYPAAVGTRGSTDGHSHDRGELVVVVLGGVGD
jgi:hypothetical protein